MRPENPRFGVSPLSSHALALRTGQTEPGWIPKLKGRRRGSKKGSPQARPQGGRHRRPFRSGLFRSDISRVPLHPESVGAAADKQPSRTCALRF